MEPIFDNTFLKSLFTSNEFDFVEHIGADIKQFENSLKEAQGNRDLLVNLINELSDAVFFKLVNRENSDEEKELLSRAESIFDLINTNILLLQKNQEQSDLLHKKIMNLLIKIESDTDNSETKYIVEINSLKQDIANIINSSNDSNSTINSNNATISNFISSDMTQKYLQKFHIECVNNCTNEEANNVATPLVSEKDYDFGSVKENNNVLLVSEISKKVYLPYSKSEVLEYLKKYPKQYKSFEDVVKQEFINPIDFYVKHPVLARFRETYSLIRDREAKSVIEAFKFAMDVMFNYNLTPAVIAACKSQAHLENYLDCLSRNKLDEFKDFEINFEITPMKI